MNYYGHLPLSDPYRAGALMAGKTRPTGSLADLPLRDFSPRSCMSSRDHLVSRARVPAVDAHNHLGKWLTKGEWAIHDVDLLLDLMARCNVRAIVNLDGMWGPVLEENLDRYDRLHQGRFFTFCQLDWQNVKKASGFTERLCRSLRESAGRGARGLKVWKDLGLHIRDDDGRLIMPDDDRLSDVWDTAADLQLPVLIHTADPVAFFLPVDRHNERLEELLEFPEWSSAEPTFPRFEALIESLEGLVAAHPRTTFIGAHAGCYAEDLQWVGRMLSAYPNFNIDIAARIAELGRQPQATRQLILNHPDRVLFGTDIFPPTAEDYAIHFRFLETADEYFDYSTDEVPPQGRWKIYGLDLPEDILERVYSGNAFSVLAL